MEWSGVRIAVDARTDIMRDHAIKAPGPIKLLIVESGHGAGGSSMALYYTLRELDRTKFDPLVAFYFSNSGPDTTLLKQVGVPIHFLSPRTGRAEPAWFDKELHSLVLRALRKLVVVPWRLATFGIPSFRQLLRLIRANSISLMLLNNDVHYHVPAVLAAKASGIPCVCRKAGGIGEGRRIKRFLTPLVDLFISISKATERDQIENNPGTRKVTTVFGGVDLGRFTGRVRAGLRAELGVPPGAKVVASIARVLPGRGQQELLRAAAQVLRSYDNVAFLFVGDESPNAGAYMSFLRAEAERMGIAGQAIFPGWRTDVPEILALVDILVQCPSTVTEGLGVVVLEAMAAGKPVVASDNGGLPDAVFHGRTGFVVPRGDSDALAQALLKLLQDEALARRMGIAGRQRAETEFNISHNVRKFEKLLEDCVITAAAGRSR